MEEGKTDKAIQLLKHALVICEDYFGRDHQASSIIINTLVIFLISQTQYDEAEKLGLRALQTLERIDYFDEFEMFKALSNLALLYHLQDKFEQSIELYLRALDIRERAQGPEYPDLASTLIALAKVYKEQGEYINEAEQLYLRALSELRISYGNDHPKISVTQKELAEFYRQQGKISEAETIDEQLMQSEKTPQYFRPPSQSKDVH